MKNTSQQYLNSEAHGYLMEAKACKLLLKDLERIRAKLKRHIEKEAADHEAEFEAAMQYHSESDIQEAYGWEFISEQQYKRYFRQFYRGHTGRGIGASLAPMPLLIIPCCGTQIKYWQSGCVSYRPFPDHRPPPVQSKASQALQASPPIWLWESALLLFPVPYLPAAKSL